MSHVEWIYTYWMKRNTLNGSGLRSLFNENENKTFSLSNRINRNLIFFVVCCCCVFLSILFLSYFINLEKEKSSFYFLRHIACASFDSFCKIINIFSKSKLKIALYNVTLTFNIHSTA